MRCKAGICDSSALCLILNTASAKCNDAAWYIIEKTDNLGGGVHGRGTSKGGEQNWSLSESDGGGGLIGGTGQQRVAKAAVRLFNIAI